MKDDEIMKKLRKRDPDVFAYISKRYTRLLWAVAGDILGRLGTAEDIEDCISDVYIKLLERPKLYDAGKGTLKSFLVRLVKNQAIDRYRQLARTQELPVSDWELADEQADDPVKEILRREEKLLVQHLLEKAPKQDQEIMMRRFYHDEKPAEISKKMNLDIKLVNNRLYQTKLKLRSLLTGEGENLCTKK